MLAWVERRDPVVKKAIVQPDRQMYTLSKKRLVDRTSLFDASVYH
jgi:hypothetical protein